MKAPVLNNGRGIEKDAFIFRALAPAVAQEQDDRMRQIIREELATSHQSQQPSIKSKNKHASIEAPFSLALIVGFSDELNKIKTAQLSVSSVAAKPTIQSPLNTAMRAPSLTKNPLTAKPPNYSQVNPASAPGPAQSHQPTLSPPPVRG